jgi:hypothetical protein
LAVFTSTVLLFLAVKLSAKTDPRRFVYTLQFTTTSTKPLFREIAKLNSELCKMSYSMVSNQEDFTTPFEETSPEKLDKYFQRF